MRWYGQKLMTWLIVLGLAFSLGGMNTETVTAQGTSAGGPVVLLGIDSEDGGPGGHGPIDVYRDVVESLLANVTNNGQDILVIGEDGPGNVQDFWSQIDAAITDHAVTFVGGAAEIEGLDFTGYAMIAIVTSQHEIASAEGLTDAENDALITRAGDIASFVNGGGGLFASSQSRLDNPWGFIGGLGDFVTNTGLSYSSILPTTEGQEIGITTDLNVCCWHDTFTEWPDFLNVLAWHPGQEETEAAALGGSTVMLVPPGPQNLVATPSNGEIHLEWEPPEDGGSNITHYNVSSGDAVGNLTFLAEVQVPDTTYTDSPLGDGVTRCYHVTAVNATGESDPSNTACATTWDIPGAPTGFQVHAGPGPGELSLQWDPPEDDGGLDIDHYSIYRGTTEDSLSFLVDVDETQTSYLDTGLGDAEPRFYRMTATNEMGEGESTKTSGSTTLPPGDPEPLPQGLSATSAVYQGHYGYVFGGRTEDNETTDSIVRFDPHTGETITTGLNLPSPRLGTSAVWAPGVSSSAPGAQGCDPNCIIGTGYIFGGSSKLNLKAQQASGATLEGNEIVAFDPEQEEVTIMNASFPDPRFATSAVWDPTENKAYIIGGFPGDDGGGGAGTAGCDPNCRVGESIMVFDASSDTLEHHEAILPVPLGGTSAVWEPGEGVAYIFGGLHHHDSGAGAMGCDPNCALSIFKFDPKMQASAQGSALEPLPVQLPGERWNTTAVFDGRYAYVIGGENETGFIDEIVKFDPVEETVEIVGSLPTERTQASAIFDGTDAFIFGGLELGNQSTDGIVRFTPSAPQQADAQPGPGVGENTLSWGEPANDGGVEIAAYRVYRTEQVDGALQLVDELPANTTQFFDTGLENGVTVHYRVSAVNNVGEGLQSPLVSATTFDLPAAPTAATATPGPLFGQLTVSWQPPVDDGRAPVSGYRVLRSDTVDGPYNEISTVTEGNLSFTDSGLGELDTRYYKVHAMNLVGQGPATPAIEARTFDPMNIFVRAGELTIQQAMDAIAPGGTIHVASGTYTEDAVLATSATIQEGTSDGPGAGALENTGRPLIIGSIRVADVANVTIKDVRIEATRGGELPGVALLTANTARVHVENATFQGDGSPQGQGLYPGLVDLRELENVTFVANQLEGAPGTSGGTSGLRLEYRPQGNVTLLVDQNTVQDVGGVGIVIKGKNTQTNIQLTENNLTRNTDGLLLFDAVFGNLTGANNQIQENNGKGVQYAGQVQGESLYRHNHFGDNDVGFAVSTQSDPVDARYNWWGTPGGPLLGDQANMLLVDYTPWCVQEECSVGQQLEEALPLP